MLFYDFNSSVYFQNDFVVYVLRPLVVLPLLISANHQSFLSLSFTEISPSHTFFMLVPPLYGCTCFHDPPVGDISAQ